MSYQLAPESNTVTSLHLRDFLENILVWGGVGQRYVEELGIFLNLDFWSTLGIFSRNSILLCCSWGTASRQRSVAKYVAFSELEFRDDHCDHLGKEIVTSSTVSPPLSHLESSRAGVTGDQGL